MNINFTELQNGLIHYLKDVIAQIQKSKMPTEINSFNITNGQLNSEKDIKTLADTLPMNGNHVYWFTVNDSGKILWLFKNREKTVDYKIARDNNSKDSECMYVGSCTRTKLKNRFLQHCGWGPNQTYSLQLKKWLSDADIVCTFSYVMVDDEMTTMHLEDQLHRQLKPLFGKSGASSKILKN